MTAILESTLSHLLLPHLVDVKALCVVPHHYVWKLHIDLFLIATSGGSLVDACSHVIHAALQNTQLPHVTPLPMSSSSNSSSTIDGNPTKPALQVDGKVTILQPSYSANLGVVRSFWHPAHHRFYRCRATVRWGWKESYASRQFFVWSTTENLLR